VKTLFVCGDVMTGRGIDQILPQPADAQLHEPYVHDAREYWRLAEVAHGPIPRPVTEDYIWGDALEEWNRVQPDVRIVNLETAVTTSDRFWKGKEIHYRMSPGNTGCLSAARIDCCTLANNHVLDWGYPGLAETLAALERAGIQAVGAGHDLRQAQAPAIFHATQGRTLVFGVGTITSGIPPAWAAGDARAGVNVLPDLSVATARRLGAEIAAQRTVGDIVVVSLHWGSNWGYEIPADSRQFAHALIDSGGADLVHGHSSHHVKGIEVYQQRLILYGCGDFLTDYEGIRGYEAYRGDLAVMYFASVDDSGKLLELQLTPLQVHQMRLRGASSDDAAWLQELLCREGLALGTRVRLESDNRLLLQWGR
jgi:poly-gamma-glutamate capsule biosynthesis protein CapA/YwtB (metallophosphatase superfamily)